MRNFCVAIVVSLFFSMNCGLMTGPSDRTDYATTLGFWVMPHSDYTGTITTAHKELADQWWIELVGDLRDAGYDASRTDPAQHVRGTYIKVHGSADAKGRIRCPGRSDLVGACYDPPSDLHVPDYVNPTTSQPMKHEMLHHWCYHNFRHLCMAPGKDEWTGHVWPAPNDSSRNIWDFTWR